MSDQPTTTTNHDDGACPHCGGNDLEWKGDLCRCEGCGRILRRCEVYSRIVGYLRPVQSWAAHKQQEFKDRRTYVVPSKEEMEEANDACP